LEGKNIKYIANCSFGKDSLATVILAREYCEPLDEIVFSEVMFDKDISGEIPEHRDFIYNVAIPKLEEWRYKVTVLKSDTTYMDWFYHIIERPRKNKYLMGKLSGFAMTGRCVVNRSCKAKSLLNYEKTIQDEVRKYVGIAVDEPKRLLRLQGTNKISLLEKYGYTEKMAKQKCIEYGLLSPIYEFTDRNGCWFCPNAKDKELRNLYKNHSDLWNKLLELEKIPNTAVPIWNILSKTSIHIKDEQFKLEDAQMTLFEEEAKV